MKKRRLAGLMTHQYKKLPVTMKMWMQLNVMPWTPSTWGMMRSDARQLQQQFIGVSRASARVSCIAYWLVDLACETITL